MKRLKRFIIISLIIIGFIIGINLKRNEIPKGLLIKKWDNVYSETNIRLFYGVEDKLLLKDLMGKYEISKAVEGSKDELDKTMKLLQWISDNMVYSKKTGDFDVNKTTFDILENKEKSKEYSNGEIITVFNEFAHASGITCRIGEFNPNVGDSFKVCEIWSNKYNKWIMVDPSNGVYLKDENIPLSSIEVLHKDLQGIDVIGAKSESKYKKQLEKILNSYLIQIDNTIYSIKQSNSYLCYLKDKNNVSAKVLLSHPIIFTDKEEAFNLSPQNSSKITTNEEIPTLIFSQKKGSLPKDVKVQLNGGVFKNSQMLDQYYISIDNGPLKEEGRYFNLDIKPGVNVVKLSLDGKKVIREVVYEYIDK